MIRSEFQDRATSTVAGERRIALALVLSLRVLAVVFFGLAIWIWGRTVGYWPGEEFRFDTMNVPSKVYSAIMCVLLPVASVGLWTTLSWGRVVWILAIIVDVGTFVLFSQQVLIRHELLSFHAFAISTYLALEIGLRLINNDE